MVAKMNNMKQIEDSLLCIVNFIVGLPFRASGLSPIATGTGKRRKALILTGSKRLTGVRGEGGGVRRCWQTDSIGSDASYMCSETSALHK